MRKLSELMKMGNVIERKEFIQLEDFNNKINEIEDVREEFADLQIESTLNENERLLKFDEYVKKNNP